MVVLEWVSGGGAICWNLHLPPLQQPPVDAKKRHTLLPCACPEPAPDPDPDPDSWLRLELELELELGEDGKEARLALPFCCDLFMVVTSPPRFLNFLFLFGLSNTIYNLFTIYNPSLPPSALFMAHSSSSFCHGSHHDAFCYTFTQTLLPILTTALTILLCIIPTPAIWSIWKSESRSLGSFNPLPMPFLSNLCLAGILYGFFLKDYVLVLANIVGFLCALIFTLVLFAANGITRRQQFIMLGVLCMW